MKKALITFLVFIALVSNVFAQKAGIEHIRELAYKYVDSLYGNILTKDDIEVIADSAYLDNINSKFVFGCCLDEKGEGKHFIIIIRNEFLTNDVFEFMYTDTLTKDTMSIDTLLKHELLHAYVQKAARQLDNQEAYNDSCNHSGCWLEFAKELNIRLY